MKVTKPLTLIFPLIATFAVPLFASTAAHAHPLKHKLPESKDGSLVIGNCDGESSVEVRGKKPGEKLTKEEAADVTRKLMASWQKKNPQVKWVMPEAKAQEKSKGPVSAAAGTQKTSPQGQKQQGTYSNFTPDDERIWKIEQGKLVDLGKEIFHSADLLKSKTAISCDMCHPDGANTHAETYPKYQVQLQRMAMLRDMINWCIENPVKGVMLKDDDPAMRALEAYITSTRAGVPLAPGKH